MDDDQREVRLQQQFPEWAVWYEQVSEARARWSARPVGIDGEPSFSTFSWEEMELWLGNADPEEVAR